MCARESSENYPVANSNVPSKRRIVGKDTVITNSTIVRDMHVSHNPVVITDRSQAFVLHGATTDRTEFANRIVITDFKPGWLVAILFVLRIITYRRELVYVVVLADFGGTIDNNMTVNPATGVNFDSVTDDGIRAYLNIISEYR
jgi:hypothetical protein